MLVLIFTLKFYFISKIITNCPKLEILHLNDNAIDPSFDFFLNLDVFLGSAEKLREIRYDFIDFLIYLKNHNFPFIYLNIIDWSLIIDTRISETFYSFSTLSCPALLISRDFLYIGKPFLMSVWIIL